MAAAMAIRLAWSSRPGRLVPVIFYPVACWMTSARFSEFTSHNRGRVTPPLSRNFPFRYALSSKFSTKPGDWPPMKISEANGANLIDACSGWKR
ncbi:uncharacterized protein BJX67DRAFT_218915 [Aspergillus lucknowensis]|uniref:Secreted protein n=1 Tax=Aspergillus lucknowensis TaxID=176173 RepID=A0ABR4M3R6_9EURO